MNDLFAGYMAEVICTGCDCESSEFVQLQDDFLYKNEAHYLVGTCKKCHGKGVPLGAYDGLWAVLDENGDVIERYEAEDFGMFYLDEDISARLSQSIRRMASQLAVDYERLSEIIVKHGKWVRVIPGNVMFLLVPFRETEFEELDTVVITMPCVGGA